MSEKPTRLTTRNTVPRLVLIFGCRSARDMVKALTVNELTEAFRAAATIAATKGRPIPSP